jgi:Uma2 family endonuclease
VKRSKLGLSGNGIIKKDSSGSHLASALEDSMTSAPAQPIQVPLNLSQIRFTDEQFRQLCLHNPEQSLELTAAGELIVMAPVGGGSGKREIELGADLVLWNRKTQMGEVFSSSTIFRLPSGAQRSPDAAWVERSRWQSLTPTQQEEFPPVAPDFLIELRSRTDRLENLQSKMMEYRENGVRLGLLINRQDREVELYRLNQPVEVLQAPAQVNCEDVLPGFNLDLTHIW